MVVSSLEKLGKSSVSMNGEGGLGFGLPGTLGSEEDQIPPAVPGTMMNLPTEVQQQPMNAGQPGTLGIMQQQNAHPGGTFTLMAH